MRFPFGQSQHRNRVPSCKVSMGPIVDDAIAELLVAQTGSAGRPRLREQRTGFLRIVSEIYSPARVTQMIRYRKVRHAMPGSAFDIAVNDPEDGLSWGFSLKVKRGRARK